jgi:ATP-dependent Clp protease ATP-binding subunit ClpX
MNTETAHNHDASAAKQAFPSRLELRLLDRVGPLMRRVRSAAKDAAESPCAHAATIAALRRDLRRLANDAQALFKARPELPLAQCALHKGKPVSRGEVLALLLAMACMLKREIHAGPERVHRMVFASMLQERRAAHLQVQMYTRGTWCYAQLDADFSLSHECVQSFFGRGEPGGAQRFGRIPAVIRPDAVLRLLDAEVAGQRQAKETLSLAVWRQSLKAAGEGEGTPDLPCPLLIGPTGTGKTHLCRTLAKGLHRPFVIASAASITTAGYVGESWSDVLTRLLKASNNNKELCERAGIVFVDEADKLKRRGETAASAGSGADIHGDMSQAELLTILGGSVVQLSTRGGPISDLPDIDTGRGMLFILGGTFDGLDAIRDARLNRRAGIGFNRGGPAVQDADPGYGPQDLEAYGFMKELVGRISGSIAVLKPLEPGDLLEILEQKRTGYLHQFAALLRKTGVRLSWDSQAAQRLAARSIKLGMGARGLRPHLERLLAPAMLGRMQGAVHLRAVGDMDVEAVRLNPAMARALARGKDFRQARPLEPYLFA